MSYLNLILLSSTWELSHRKGLHSHLRNSLSEWSDVIFIESPFSLLIHTFLKFRTRVLEAGGKKKSKGNIETFMPFIIFHRKIWNRFPVTLTIDVSLLVFQIKRFAKKKYSGSKLIIWASYPFDYPFLEKMNSDFIIYDFYDNFSFDEDGSFSYRKDKFNKKLIMKCDLIFCTAVKLFDFAMSLNSGAFYLSNGHNILFADKTEKADLNISGKIIGYLGNIRHWIDFDLINELVRKLGNDQYLVFIGPVEKNVSKEINSLKKNKQFRHIDAVRYEEIYSYIKSFDVGIIPFKNNDFMEGVFPNKFFEYVSCGIKIVTTNLPDMYQYKEVINIAENYDEFISMCLSNEYKLNFDIEMYKKIRSESSWDLRADFMNNEVKKLLCINSN